MTTFGYTSGNPNNLVPGGDASMADIQGPFVDIRDFLNGGIDTTNLATAAGVKETQLANGSNGLGKGSFSAYRAAAVTLVTTGVVPFETEEFDVSGWFDTSNGRFTPQVPGWYRFSWAVGENVAMVADAFWFSYLRKNGTALKIGSLAVQRGAALIWSVGSAVAVANGTTDFFTVTVEHNNGAGMPIAVGASNTYFQGELIGRV